VLAEIWTRPRILDHKSNALPVTPSRLLMKCWLLYSIYKCVNKQTRWVWVQMVFKVRNFRNRTRTSEKLCNKPYILCEERSFKSAASSWNGSDLLKVKWSPLALLLSVVPPKSDYLLDILIWCSSTTFQSFSDIQVRVRVRVLKTLRTRTQRVCLFTHLHSKEVNLLQKNSEISIFSFWNSYYSLY
jgi:hypothetical protein